MATDEARGITMAKQIMKLLPVDDGEVVLTERQNIKALILGRRLAAWVLLTKRHHD